MNITNNMRFQSTEEKIEKALFSLLHIRNYNDIFVKEICYEAGINRSSFYAHYSDINDLMMRTEQKLSNEIYKIFSSVAVYRPEHFVKLFEFLKSKQEFYRAYLSTNNDNFIAKNDFLRYITNKCLITANNGYFNESELHYHLAFFSGGLLAISKMWLLSGCKESPEYMANVIFKEYNTNIKYFK